MKRISFQLDIIRNCEIDVHHRTLFTIFMQVIHITYGFVLFMYQAEYVHKVLEQCLFSIEKHICSINMLVKTFQPEDKDLDFKNGILKSDDQVAQFRACGVCLLDVDAASQDFVSEEQCAKLTYGGRQYHAVCANLWVNCVDSMLPALRLPELL